MTGSRGCDMTGVIVEVVKASQRESHVGGRRVESGKSLQGRSSGHLDVRGITTSCTHDNGVSSDVESCREFRFRQGGRMTDNEAARIAA